MPSIPGDTSGLKFSCLRYKRKGLFIIDFINVYFPV